MYMYNDLHNGPISVKACSGLGNKATRFPFLRERNHNRIESTGTKTSLDTYGNKIKDNTSKQTFKEEVIFIVFVSHLDSAVGGGGGGGGGGETQESRLNHAHK